MTGYTVEGGKGGRIHTSLWIIKTLKGSGKDPIHLREAETFHSQFTVWLFLGPCSHRTLLSL